MLTEKRQAKQTQQSKPSTSSHRGLSNQLESPSNNSQKPQLDIPGPSYQHEMLGPGKRNQHHQKKKSLTDKASANENKRLRNKIEGSSPSRTKAKQRQRQLSRSSRVQLDTTQLCKNKSIRAINLASDSSQGSPITTFTSKDHEAFMTAPSTQKPDNPAHTNRKRDKINNQISNSPTEQLRQETEQLISIIPADHSTPTEEKTATKRANEHGDPTKQNTYNIQVETHGQSDDINTDEQQQAYVPTDNTPEERQNTEEVTKIIQMEDADQGDKSTLSSFSSLNTEDTKTQEKIFD